MPQANDVIQPSSDPNSQLRLYVGFTLVDITKTGVTHYRSEEEIFLRNQQHNWETLVQILGLRAQPILLEAPTIVEGNLVNFDFGQGYTGKNKIWTFKFGVEHASVYTTPDREFGILEQDFSKVPILVGLDETVSFEDPVFYTTGSNKNIYFKSL